MQNLQLLTSTDHILFKRKIDKSKDIKILSAASIKGKNIENQTQILLKDIENIKKEIFFIKADLENIKAWLTMTFK